MKHFYLINHLGAEGSQPLESDAQFKNHFINISAYINLNVSSV